MKSGEIIELPDRYSFKETNTQLIYRHFDGSNINTISRWKVGLNCNIENIRSRILTVPEFTLNVSELIDYINDLEYKDSKI